MTIPVLATLAILVIAVILVYAVVQLRKGPAPPPADESAHMRAAADEDPVPRDPSGRPMVAPPSDPAEQDVSQMQAEAGERLPEDRVGEEGMPEEGIGKRRGK